MCGCLLQRSERFDELSPTMLAATDLSAEHRYSFKSLLIPYHFVS
jgi:hypothetical protein